MQQQYIYIHIFMDAGTLINISLHCILQRIFCNLEVLSVGSALVSLLCDNFPSPSWEWYSAEFRMIR